MSEVEVGVEGGVGRLTLNRPASMNALTLSMMSTIDAALRAWADDPRIAAVELSGAGERGFCAGADVKALREHLLAGRDSAPFFAFEYALDLLIAEYPKPVTALMRGITMGGGLGLTAHAADRVVYPDSRLAMPETLIGLFPDVGVLYELSRAPGELGTHLALTGTTIGAADALLVGLADRAEGDPGPATLDHQRSWIDVCYQGSDPRLIVRRLLGHADPDARAAGHLIEQRCPYAVWVSLLALRRAAGLTSVADVLAQDLRLAPALAARPDFAEGVRARLVDRDQRPRWSPASLDEVDPDQVLALVGHQS